MKYKYLLLLMFFSAFFISTGTHDTVHASIADLTIQTGCAEGTPSYTGVLQLKSQTYDVYVRLAKRGEQANVQGYVQPKGDFRNCQSLGSLSASGDKWQKIGQFNSFEEREYVLQLSSASLAGLPDANRPAFMLVPRDNPVCVPDIECVVVVSNETGYVRPTGTLLNQNSLHVLQVVDPAHDTIKLVRYYVDDTLMYTTDSLQKFDMRYVTYQDQKLSRVIEYVSGQRVVIETTAPQTHADNFNNFLFRLSKAYPETFRTVLWIAGILLAVSLTLAIIHAIQRHRDWEYHHGFLQKERHELTAHEVHFIDTKEKAFKIFRWSAGGLALIGAMVTIIVLLNAFVIQIFTVDGRSMQSGLATGDKVLINKVPKTLAALNGLEYTPKRDDVVVLRAVFGTTAFSVDDGKKLYIIKRVIGVPGDRVVIKDGTITIFNKDNPDGFDPDQGSPWQKTYHPNVKTEFLDIQLSTSELFVTGDNRPESIDSRFNGPIATKEVVGTMMFRIWPLNNKQ